MKYKLTLTATQMQNIDSFKPISDLDDPKADFCYTFKLKCESCGLVMEDKSMSIDETMPIPGSRGRRHAHITEECTKCPRKGHIIIRPLLDTDMMITAANPSAILTVLEIDGLIPFDFNLAGPVWQITNVGGITYTDIDLEEGVWLDDNDEMPGFLEIKIELDHLKKADLI